MRTHPGGGPKIIPGRPLAEEYTTENIPLLEAGLSNLEAQISVGHDAPTGHRYGHTRAQFGRGIGPGRGCCSHEIDRIRDQGSGLCALGGLRTWIEVYARMCALIHLHIYGNEMNLYTHSLTHIY